MSVIRRKRNYRPISSTEESTSEITFGTYDKNSSLRENSNNVHSVLQNCSSKQYMNTYKSNIKRKDNINNQKRHKCFTSDSDLDNSDNDNRASKKKIKRTENKKQTIVDYDLVNTSSSNSSLFGIQNKTTHLRTNNGNKKRCNIVEEIRFVREDNVFDRQNYHNSHLIEPNTSILQNRQEKQKNVENFKPHIENVIEGLKYKFSKYNFHIRQIQSKYITGNIITLQNVENIMFIFSSIISKLKEELTEQQKILENCYLKWTMKFNLNEQSNCNINNEDMEIENESFNDDVLEMMELSMQNSNETFSENTHRKQSSDTTKRLEKNVWENNKNTKFQQNIRNNNNRNNEIPLKTKDSIVETNQTLITQTDNKNKTVDKSKKNVLSVLSDLKDINIVKVPKTYSTVNKKNISKRESLSQNITDTLKQPFNSKQNESTKKEIIDDSDICSTCSTVAFYSPQHKHILLSNVDKQTNKLVNINEDENSDDSESLLLEPTMSVNEICGKSEETVINKNCSSNRNGNFNIQHIETKSNRNSQIVSKVPVALSNNKDPILQKQLNSVPCTNKSSNKKYQVTHTCNTYKDIDSNKRLINQVGKNIVDKKLGLICQVVVDKYKQ
ncbi:hypothetical protein K0M31_014643 [Melipona bicolor]|uniref:Uncharacterized protein n=1 Tax=Melipona bicolor TaxID=60889 RepID=A0AA40KG16_9HYME|nr:hypothetical protein K0M31_014643 [Melipona bicolor]